MSTFEKAILKRIDVFLKMFYTILIFAFDSSSYKSKTTDEIKHDILIKDFVNFEKIIEKYL